MPERPAAAAAGLVSAAVALAFGEMVAGIAGTPLSPVVAVGNRVVDLAPKAVRDAAIDMLGTADKPVLIAGIGVILALAAAGVGVWARHRLVVAPVAFFLVGGVGALAATVDERASVAAVLAPMVAAAAGTATMWFTFTFTVGEPMATGDVAGRPIDRRRFLTIVGGGLVLAAGATAVGRLLQQRTRAVASRLGVRLPRARTPGPTVPDAASLEVEGLSPLYTPNRSFYRIDTALLVPQVPAESWELRVHGMVDRELTLTYEDVLARPLTEADITMACVSNEVGGGLVGSARWLGVPLQDLLAEVGVDPEADQVVGRSVDGFTAGFPTALLGDGRPALLAVGMNGEPLPLAHGFPARLVVAGVYGYVSATKWLSSIELTRFDAFDAYWVRRGWARRAPIKTMSRIDTPTGGRRLGAGPIPVAGVAWAPTRDIERVEVQVDDGPWDPARLSAPVVGTLWRQWVWDWDAPPGRHRLRVRATDGTGEVQPEQRDDPFPDGATGWHTVTVEVG